MAKYYRRRRAFTKRQARAIQAIAKKPLETKYYFQSVYPQISPTSHYISGVVVGTKTVSDQAQARYLINVFGRVPREVLGLGAQGDVEGNEFESVGVKVRFMTEVVGTRNYRWRISLVSSGNRQLTFPNSPVGNTIDNTDYDWMKQDTAFFEPTIQPFNPDNVRVLRQWNWTQTVDGSTTKLHNFYHRITGRKKLELPEGDSSDQSFVGKLALTNYYLIIEWYTPTTGVYTPSTSDSMTPKIEWTVYFKDS